MIATITQTTTGVITEHVITVTVVTAGLTVNNISGSPLPVSLSFTSQTNLQVLHNRGVRPIVEVFDSSGKKVVTDIYHDSVNEFHVVFASSFTGSLSYI